MTINGDIKNASASSEGLSVSYGRLKINGNGKINVTYGTKSIPTSNVYITKDIITAGLIQNVTSENINTVPVNNYFNFQNVIITNNKISLDYKRNSTEYVAKSLGMTSSSAMNTALNLENSFVSADNNDSFLQIASGILVTPNALLPRTIDSLSAEIYASSQNLIFKQLKEINRDLSNRMALISDDENKNMAGIWFNGIGQR